MTNGQPGGIGDEEADGIGGALGREIARLLDEFFGEIERGQIRVAEVPEPDGRPARAAAGLEQRRGFVLKIFFDQHALRFPQPEKMRRARVMHDRDRVVEIGADGG